MQEIWKNITGYEGQYQVSNLGRIKSLQRTMVQWNGRRHTTKESIRKTYLDKDGYFRIGLRKKEVTNFLVHRLVAQAFLGMSELQINHKNGNKKDNNILNLEYVTQLRNKNHAVRSINKKEKYGVNFHKPLNKWKASIYSEGKAHHLGVFVDKEEAHDIFYFAYTLIHGVTPW